MRIVVLSFPGSNCDDDALHVARSVLGAETVKLSAQGAPSSRLATRSSCRAASPTVITCARAPWPRTRRSWARCALSPSVADPCSPSATASRSPARQACSPGALTRNASLQFACRDVLRPGRGPADAVHRAGSPPGACSRCPSPTPRGASSTRTRRRSRRAGQVIFRYVRRRAARDTAGRQPQRLGRGHRRVSAMNAATWSASCRTPSAPPRPSLGIDRRSAALRGAARASWPRTVGASPPRLPAATAGAARADGPGADRSVR